MEYPSWSTEDVDLERPSVARVYDYFLGGSHNFAVDRAMAAELLKLAPDAADIMRANRAFLRRAVRFMSRDGIDQFLDIGSGIPTVGNVHEIAQRANPSSRVVYVDIDPVAVAHSRAMLASDHKTAIVRADLREPEAILAAPEVAQLIDFGRPVGLLLVSVLHFVTDTDDPWRATAQLRDALATGSYVGISHVARESRPETVQVQDLYQRSAHQAQARPRDEIAAFFGDFTLVEPGLVYLPQWRPDAPDETNEMDENPERFVALAGVGQKP